MSSQVRSCVRAFENSEGRNNHGLNEPRTERVPRREFISANVQAGVAASKHQLCRSGPQCTD
eukprot:6518971-Alexandrium_andersonii.AAC.1